MHLDTLPPFSSSSSSSFLSDELHQHLCCCSVVTPLNSPLLPFSPASASSNSQAQDQTIFHFPPTLTLQSVPAIKEEWLQHQQQQVDEPTPFSSSQQYSPMVISPSVSMLNTPRGSITSMRSHLHSPMNTERGPSSSSPFLEHNLLSSYGGGDNLYEDGAHFESNYSNYPSPPRSGYASPVLPYQQPPPPSYDEHMSINYYEQFAPLVSAAPTALSGGCVLLAPLPEQLGSHGHHQHHHQPDAVSVSASAGALSDTCPETPDSSFKDEPATPEEESGCYGCLWVDCNLEFESQRSLVDHVTEAHVESSKKGCEERPCLWMDCPRKLKPFNAKYKLSTHMRVHTKEKPYKCEHEGCSRAFARLENRKIHLRSHTGHKPFPCKFSQEFNCNKKFSNSSDRAKHEQTHKDPKPYRCEVLGCTKRYTDPSSLRKHVKSHSQEEQLQYRRSKDHANLAKRSSSPGCFSWPTQQQSQQQQADSAAAAQDVMQHFSGSSTTLLSVGLQSGGTMMNLEETTSSPAGSACSPMMHNMLAASAENKQAAYQGLPHQPSSLDDLDGETIPFDDVPLRYDASDNFELTSSGWSHPEDVQTASNMALL